MKPIIFALAIITLLQSCGGKATTQPTTKKTEAIPVKLVSIQSTAAAPSIALSGLLTTEEEATLSFKIGGIIDNMLVSEGSRVRKGQLLATIKTTEIGAQLQQVQLSVDKAERDFSRAQNLYRDSVGTLEQLQNAQTGLDVARQQYRQVAFNKQYAAIYAPADGFVVRKLGNIGELANAGTPVIIMNAVASTSNWELKAGVPDKDWALIEPGNKATVVFDAFPQQTFSGIVSRKELAADPVTGLFSVALKINFKGVQPGAGIFGKAVVYPLKETRQVSIPYEALLEANGSMGYVFVTNDQRTVKRVPVSLGMIGEQNVNVTSGLEGFHYLVTSGSPYLKEGAPIMVVK